MSYTLVSAYEAGGAEVVSSWLLHRKDIAPWFLLEGPAVSVFKRKFGDVEIRGREETFSNLLRFDRVVTSTGLGAAGELSTELIARAKRAGVPVSAYLDHWVNYLKRFQTSDGLVLPDEIWVADPVAEKLAASIFDQVPIRLEPNRYLADIADEIAKLPSSRRESSALRVLYLADVTHPGVHGYTEFEAAEGYLRYLAGQRLEVEGVRFRLHPSEAEGKYGRIIREFSRHFPITESSSGRATLAEDIAWADWVVGCDTMALVIGVHAGKEVFSCIPQGGKPMSLPYPQIKKLFTG